MSLSEIVEVNKAAIKSATRQEQAQLPYTDLGNARRLVLRHGADLRFSHASKSWFCWDGRRWIRDNTGEVKRRAKETAISILQESRPDDSRGTSGEARDHAMKSQSASSIRAMIELACSEPSIPIEPEAFDRDPLLLNVENGVVDLRIGELHPHRREDYITRMAPVEYTRTASCPLWSAFLDRICGERSWLPGFLQRVSGYALTGLTLEQVFFLLYGAGANGKSTFLNVLLDLVGSYGLQTPTETVMARRDNSIPNDVARLKGRRLVAAIETEDDRSLSEARVKQFTGEDRVAARFLFGEWFEFVPAFKLFLAVNHKPNIRGSDEAIWRRVILIPLTETIPDHERDKELGKKLRNELPGILNWALEGCLWWQAEGLAIPPEVRDATADYRAEMDVLAGFLEKCCVIAPEAQITKERLYVKYSGYCKDHREKPISKRSFGMRILEHGFTDHRTGSTRFWRGIRGKPVSIHPADAIRR